MDENQITNRPERARPETGFTDGPPESGVSTPPTPRRQMRWWMPVAVLVLMGGAIAFFLLTDHFDQATRSLAVKAACLALVVLLFLWYVFFTGLRWRTKLLLGGLGFVLAAAFLVGFRVDGATGDMGFRFVWRWAPPRDATLPQLAPSALSVGRDVTINASDFPQFLGPNRDAVIRRIIYPDDWSSHPPRQVWRQPIGAGWGAFAVAGDLAITQEQRGDEELTVARDRKTGEPVWSHGNTVRFIDNTRMGGDGPRATPTIAGGKVFAHGATGILDCLDGATGKLLWTHDTLKESAEGNIQWGVSASPLVIDDLGLVVITLGSGGPGGAVAAYEVNSGERKWVAGTDKASYASPMLATLSGKRQVVVIGDQWVTGHDPAEGTVLWQYDWGSVPAKASQPPVLNGDSLLLTGGYGLKGVLLRVKHDGPSWTTEEVWTTGHMRTKFTTPVVLDHYAYGLNDGVLTCIDLDNEGSLVWQAGRAGQPDHFGHGQILLWEDRMLVQSESGEIALVRANPEGFHKFGVLPAFTSKTWNNPAVAGEYLFVRNDQEAACYDLTVMAEK